MGGGGQSTTVQKSDPWEGIQGFLSGNADAGIHGLYGRAYDWMDGSGPQYYQGQSVIDPSAATLDAENQTLYNARYGTPSLNQAKDYFSNAAYGSFLGNDATAQGARLTADATARGDYINGNPWLSSMTEAATRDINRDFTRTVLPGVASQFAAGGRYGSGAQAGVLGDVASDYTTKIGDITSNIYAQNYAQERGLMESAISRERGFQESAIARERGLQQQAAGALPGLANEDWNNLARMAAVGTQRDQRAQARLDADKAKWDFEQNLPLYKMQAFSQLLQGFGGLGGTVSSQSTPGSGGFLSNALGGAMLANAGYGLGSNLGLLGGGAAGGGMLSGAGGAMASGLGAGAPLSYGLGAGGLFTGAAAGSGATNFAGLAALAL